MPRHSYREHDYSFGQAMLTLRKRLRMTQADLAGLLGVSRRAVGEWEGGLNYAREHHLQHLIELCVQQHVFAPEREAEEIRALWKTAHQRVFLDEDWLAALLARQTAALDPVEEAGEAAAVRATFAPVQLSPAAETPLSQVGGETAATRVDWVGALDVSHFTGREAELAELSHWMMQEQCRLVAILGMGGIGKSALVSLLGQQLAPQFDSVLWRSLRDAPPCEELVADCLTFFSETPPAAFPPLLEPRINQLLGRLQAQRCLLVLDNLEMLLEEGDPEGGYRPGYQGYGRLLERLGEATHRSCVVLTSREKPREIEAAEGLRGPVRSLRLVGLSQEAARSLLSDKNLRGTSSAWRELIASYAGNPLALKIVGQAIVDLFAGDIDAFLHSGELIFNGIRVVLRQQVARLTPLEQMLLTWLAVVREWTAPESLLSLLVRRPTRRRLLEALEGLWRRSLIERGQGASFTLQSVVMEYVTDALLDHLSEEIRTLALDHLRRYALEQAQAKDYVRETQVRLLVRPLLERLRAELGSDARVEGQCLSLLRHVRTEEGGGEGYGSANVISLLKALRSDLCDLDLSGLSIRGAYLQGVEMQDTTLAGSSLHETVWTSPFNALLSIAVSPDGRLWAAGSNRGEVRVWREEGRVAHVTLQAQTDRISGLAFSPDGETLVTASWNGRIEFWDPTSGAALGVLREHDMAVTSIVYRPGGRQFASSSYDRTVRIWDVRDGTCLHILRANRAPVLALAWSPDGRVLASAGFDQTIRLWDAEQGTLLRELRGHLGYVTGLAFAPSGSTLASSSFDATVRLWEVKTGTCIRTFIGHTGAVSALAWSPGGQMVASCGYDTTIRLWDLASEQCRSVLWGHTGLVLSLAFTPDGKWLLSGSHDQTLRVWESEGGRSVRILQGYAVSLFAVAWRPDGHALVDGSSDAMLSLWNPHDHTPAQTLRGHTQCINDVTWSPVGGLLASSSDDQTVRLWDTRTGACLRILRGHRNLVNGIAWHPGGNLLASSSTDQTIRVWDVREGVSRWTGTEHTGTVTSVAWHPNGTLLASSSEDHSVRIWQAERGEVLLRLEGHEGPVYNVAWSPDGRRLASCGGSGRSGELLVWDVVGGDRLTSPGKRVLASGTDISPVFSLAWSLDGTLLMSGGTDGRLYWWEIDRETSPLGEPAHEGWIHSIRLSPDGETVASAGEDGAIQLWNMRSRRHLFTLRRDRPYERLTITGIRGLTEAQKASLHALGAFEETSVGK